MIQITKKFRFEASHVLPLHPGKCSRLHGHSWEGWVTVEGKIHPETGFVCDYAVLSKLIEYRIVNLFDHQHLGQGSLILERYTQGTSYPAVLGEAFYPSSENLVTRISSDLLREIQANKETYGESTRLVEVGLNETCTSSCVWRPDARSKSYDTYGV